MTRVEVEACRALRFDDGSPVRAASAVAPLGDGWLVAQDDAAHAAWVREASVQRVRIVPAVDGHDVFSVASGTKHLKPDFEAGCAVDDGVLLLGSGSTPARMRAAVVRGPGHPEAAVADLTPLYERVARELGLDLTDLNLEGACVVGRDLRWFARGNLAAGVPSSSVDVPLDELVAAVLGGPADVRVQRPRRYDLGAVDGVGLTVTDAVTLPDGRLLVSAAAEDTPNAVDDGPVVAAAVALLEDDRVLDVVPLPEVDRQVTKVEGLALLDGEADGVRLVAVVDADDPETPSSRLVLRVRWS